MMTERFDPWANYSLLFNPARYNYSRKQRIFLTNATFGPVQNFEIGKPQAGSETSARSIPIIHSSCGRMPHAFRARCGGQLKGSRLGLSRYAADLSQWRSA
jgi:hypothetical protein